MAALGMNANTVALENVEVKSATVSQKGGQWFLNLDLDISNLKLGRDRQIALVPVLSNADSTVVAEFQPITIAGHNLYYKHLRDNDLDPEGILVKSGQKSALMYVGSTDAFTATDDYKVNLNYRVGVVATGSLLKVQNSFSNTRPSGIRPRLQLHHQHKC